MKADRCLYLTVDGEVVEETDVRQVSQLVGEGCELADDNPQGVSMGKDGRMVIPKPAEPVETSHTGSDAKAVEAPPENKALAAPDEHKAVDMPKQTRRRKAKK